MQVGRASDIWSLGCILYQMVYGHTPFSALAFIQKMHAITDPNYRIAFPPIKNAALLDVMQRCLDRNPRTRITMQVRCHACRSAVMPLSSPIAVLLMGTVDNGGSCCTVLMVIGLLNYWHAAAAELLSLHNRMDEPEARVQRQTYSHQ